MKNQHTDHPMDHHCSVREQRHLVSEMTRCDRDAGNHEDRYECYQDVSIESRENKACLFS